MDPNPVWFILTKRGNLETDAHTKKMLCEETRRWPRPSQGQRLESNLPSQSLETTNLANTLISDLAFITIRQYISVF